MASRIAARSTIAGHAGEVLHQHARGRVGDLAARARPWPTHLRHAPRRPRPRRCAAGSRAAPSASTAGARRRTSSWSASSRKISYDSPPTSSVEAVGHVPKTLACSARPGLRRPPPLDPLGRHRTVPEIARAGRARQGRRGAAHRPRHARGQAQRRGGLVRRRAAAGRARRSRRRRRNHYLAFGIDEEIDHRGLDAVRHLRAPCATPAASASPRTRSPRASSASSAPRHAVRRARLRRAPRHRAVELRRTTPARASREHPRDASASSRRPGACSTTRPSATCARWDELCRDAARGRDRRPRRAPVRQADRPGRAAAA